MEAWQVSMKADITVYIVGHPDWDDKAVCAVAQSEVSLWPPFHDNVALELENLEAVDVVRVEDFEW